GAAEPCPRPQQSRLGILLWSRPRAARRAFQGRRLPPLHETDGASARSSLIWEYDREPRPFSRLALDVDLSPMSPYCFQRDRQAKPRAASGLLRRKKWLKNLCELLGIHPASRIGKFHCDKPAMV